MTPIARTSWTWRGILASVFTVVLLASAMAAIYVGTIVGVDRLLAAAEIHLDLQVAAAALVAVSFYPARHQARRLANRIVYGHRATPYDVLARFSRRAAEDSDDEVLSRIPRLVVDGTGAEQATLWVKSGEGFAAVASWPEGLAREPIGAAGEFLDPGADQSLPISHGGELLGGLSLVRGRGGSETPAEEQLLAGLTAGLGVVLHNHGLTAELRRQVNELAASRDRVVAAADEARRTLERDLDSGPQQRLVAVKVMLGPIRKQAEESGAERTAQILAQLESDAGEAIRSVREFAGGIYPPLLEAEGVGPAVTQQIQRASLPVTLDSSIGRHPREIEAAVYFSILEALQNAAKYARASSARVELQDGGGSLVFRVMDDGIGFDPTGVRQGSGLSNMRDRLDAVGGRLRVLSAPGAGTTVEGTIPLVA